MGKKVKQEAVAMSPEQTYEALNGLADFVGQDRQKVRLGFLRCIAEKIGWIKLFQCLGQGKNWLVCVGESVDLGEIIQCVSQVWQEDILENDEF